MAQRRLSNWSRTGPRPCGSLSARCVACQQLGRRTREFPRDSPTRAAPVSPHAHSTYSYWHVETGGVYVEYLTGRGRGAPCRLGIAIARSYLWVRGAPLSDDPTRCPAAAISPVSPTFDRLSTPVRAQPRPATDRRGPTPVTPRRDLGFKTLAPEDHAVVRELTDRIAEVSELAPHGPTRRVRRRLTGRPDRGGADTRGTAMDAPRPAWGRD
jgi:hypothetical protein